MGRIRKVKLSTDTITTIAGTGTAGYAGDAGPATSAQIGDGVVNIAADKNGNIYLAEVNNKVIRKIDPSGVITTIAGQQGVDTPSGNDGPASAATFNTPWDIEYDPVANCLYISDYGAGSIRKIDLSTNIISLVSGSFNHPKGIAVDASGDIFVAEEGTSLVKMIAFDKANEITLLGKGQEIISGSVTPALANGTDMGTVSLGKKASAVFTIKNDGNASLDVGTIDITGSTDFFYRSFDSCLACPSRKIC